MPDKTPPPRQRPAAKGRDDAPPRNGIDSSRRAELVDEPPELLGREQPAGDGTQAEEAREIAASTASNGNLHHEVPAHPGVPLAPPGIVPESDVRTHSPAAATPPKEHGFVEELGELPWSYGDGRLVALIRDPQTIYVYWDLSQQQIEQAFGGLGSARASLKLWNVRGNELIREVEVHLDARGWYVRELPSDVLDEVYATLPLGSALRGDPVAGGRPLAWKSGAAPPGWERRMQPRYSTTSPSGGALPWSGTAQKKK